MPRPADDPRLLSPTWSVFDPSRTRGLPNGCDVLDVLACRKGAFERDLT
jgi:hypothetical protein